MQEIETVAVQSELDALRTTALHWAEPELERAARAVIADLTKRPALGTFGDLAARHLWDEYCWNHQEGPFGDDLGWDGVSLGSSAAAFEDLALTAAMAELEGLPRHVLALLSALASELSTDLEEWDEPMSPGTVWPDALAKLVVEKVNAFASRRSLDLIGPNRSECIRSETKGGGIVWDFLAERGEAWDIAVEYVDDLVDPESDLEPLADALVEGFISAAGSETAHSALSDFFSDYKAELQKILFDYALVNVTGMRAELVISLDG